MKIALYICYTALAAVALTFLGTLAVVVGQIAWMCLKMGYIPAP